MQTADYLESLQNDLSRINTALELSEGTNFTDIAEMAENGDISTGGGDLSDYFNENPIISSWTTTMVQWAAKNYFKKLPTLNIPSHITSLQDLFKVYYLSVYPKVICGSNVTNMISLYSVSSSSIDTYVTSIDVSGLNTSNVTSMSSMFANQKYLTTVDVSTFNVSKVTSFQNMFSQCQAIDNLDLSNWQFTTTNNINLQGMFSWCSSLNNIQLPSNFINTKVTNINQLFTSCGLNIGDLDSSGWDTSGITTASNAFSDNSKTTAIDFSNLTFDNLTTSSAMLSSMSKVTTIDLTDMVGTKVTNASYMFNNDVLVTSIKLTNFNPTGSINASSMFTGCRALQFLDIRSFDLTKVSNSKYMFGYTVSDYLPANCLIIVKDQTSKDWMNTNWNYLTNVQTAAEYEANASI